MKYWEIIADNLSKAGWSWGCVSIRGCREETGSGNKGKSIRTLGGIWIGGR